MSLLAIIGGLFSTSKASNTAVDIVRKITGTDGLTDQEKLSFVIEHLKATQHQSIPRRIIAVGLFGLYAIFLLTWLFCFFFMSGEHVDSLQLFMKDVLLTPFNIVLGFYFTINIVKGLSK